MAETSRPWGGTVLGDCGPYSDAQWNQVWRTLVKVHWTKHGVFVDQLNYALGGVTGTSLGIEMFAGPPISYKLYPGRAMVDGTWYYNSSAVTLSNAHPVVNPRIDRVVLRKSFAAQTVRATVIQGAEAATPLVPALTQAVGVTWDLPLWIIYRTPAGGMQIYLDEREFIGHKEFLDSRLTESGDTHWAQFSDDFYSQLGQWTYAATAASGAFLASIYDFGVYSFSSDTSAAGTATISTPVTHPMRTTDRWKARLATPNTHANVRDRAGMFSAVPISATPDPAEGIYFRRNGAGNWFAVCRTGGVETALDTSQAADAAWHKFEIRRGGPWVVFLLDDVIVATIATNVPLVTTALLLAFNINYAGAPTAARRMDIDWVQYDSEVD